MLIDRRRSNQNDAGVVGHNLRVSNDFLQVGLVFLQRDVLLAWGIRKAGIVGSKEDGLVGLFSPVHILRLWRDLPRSGSWPVLERE
jgi:hypothetical protein